MNAGELVYVPRDTKFGLEFASRYAEVYVFANGEGLVRLLRKLGQDCQQRTLPEEVIPCNASELDSVALEVGLQLV